MDLHLSGKVFLITGASAGIGAATCALLADEGATAIGVSRKPGTAQRDGIVHIAADVTDPATGAMVVDEVFRRYGRLDGLVNNVGGLRSHSGFLDVTDEDWTAAFDLNFHAAVRMTRAAIPALLGTGGGSLVHVTSEAARFPAAPLVDYAAAKTALLSVSKVLAAEFGERGIRSNIVAPGPTRTRLWDEPGGFAEQLAARFDLPVDAAIERFVRDVRDLPTGRLGSAEEVAGVVGYLLSPLARQVTGAEWAIDGGALRQL
jgi:NAD(P)-dependent dehydrogenase (short-subunit alcohol dehydrogenase family)